MATTHWHGWVEPDLTPRDAVPLFPNTSFVPDSACPHAGKSLVPGSRFCCMVCHSSGLDALPALQRDPRTDPKPEPKATGPAEKPKPVEPKPTSGKMSRRRKAKKLQGAA